MMFRFFHRPSNGFQELRRQNNRKSALRTILREQPVLQDLPLGSRVTSLVVFVAVGIGIHSFFLDYGKKEL
jgi:hypothetical protein